MVSLLKRLSRERVKSRDLVQEGSDIDMFLSKAASQKSLSAAMKLEPQSSSNNNLTGTPIVKRRSLLSMMEEQAELKKVEEFSNSPIVAPVSPVKHANSVVEVPLPVVVDSVDVLLACEDESMCSETDTSYIIEDESLQSVNEEQQVYEQAILFTDEYAGILNCHTLDQKLFYACRMKNDRGLATLHKLIAVNKMLDVNTVRDYESCNAGLLHAAAAMNNVECMQFLAIRCEADVNLTDAIDGTPLFYACAHGCNNAVHFLASNGANINAKDQYDMFPLLIALKNNHLDVVKTLLLYNADINLKSKRGNTCLHVAAKEGYVRRVVFLMDECGASVPRSNNDNENALLSGLCHPAIVQVICERLDYKTLTKCVSMLNSQGQTVFHVAAYNGYLDSFLIIIQLLCQKGEDNKIVEEFLEQRLNEPDNAGYAPIHLATCNEYVSYVRTLAACSQVNINLKEKKSGNTALHMAILANNVELTQLLIELGEADVSIKNNNNESCEVLRKRAGIEVAKTGSFRRRVSRTLKLFNLPRLQ